MHERKSYKISLNHRMLYAVTYKRCFLFNEGFNQLIDIFRNWGIEERAKGNLRRKFTWLKCKRKEGNLRRIQILFHAVLVFPLEMSRNLRLPLLRPSGFQYRNQAAEEVQEHEVPSACRRTTVSLRPRTQFRKRKSYL